MYVQCQCTVYQKYGINNIMTKIIIIYNELVPFSLRSKVEHPKVNISYITLMYWIVFEDLSKTLEHSIHIPPNPDVPPRKSGKAQRKSARVIRVLRVSTWESASGCRNGSCSRTPKHVAVGAIPELRAPIFAGFFHVRGGWVINLTENGTSSKWVYSLGEKIRK